MTERRGFRGYISSRKVLGNRAAQHVQNLVIRDYCRQHNYHYLLSATEYAMPGCFMMLEQVIQEMPTLNGLVLYSIFQLPDNRARRLFVYQSVFEAGATLHSALEGLSMVDEGSTARAEDIFRVQQILPCCPGKPE